MIWHNQKIIKNHNKKTSCEEAVVSPCAVMLFYVFLSSFVVFLRYQIYYDYPLQTYLEYPIIIAQGNLFEAGVWK